MIVQDSFDIHPTLNTGLVTGTIIGNDQILCGNVASTWYQVTPMDYAFAGTSQSRHSRLPNARQKGLWVVGK
jgi:hypothetical protein